jgi:quinone-modifying oxidoreductase, subunit QmoC
MTSYMLMFSFIVLFLEWFQTDKIYSITHPQRWVGYYITFGLVFATVSYAISRIKKKEPVFKFTHHSDWIFLFLLFMIAVTGILIHFFRIGGMANATYYMYAIHLAFEVPMVFTFVAFSKWSHLAYRPAAIYFSNLKKSAAQQEAQAPAAAVTV